MKQIKAKDTSEPPLDCTVGRWIKKDREWREYPIGTRARESWKGWGYQKTAHGWKADGGSIFPRPGCSDEVMLPLAARLIDRAVPNAELRGRTLADGPA